jgi:16S rRNA processing protein RimM
MTFRYIGSVVRPYESHGRALIGDIPQYVHDLPPGCSVSIGYSSAYARSYKVLSCSRTPKGLIVELSGITTPEAVQALKNMGVFADEQLVRSLGNVRFFDDEIVGCAVINHETGETLGTVTDVWQMPASDIWVMDWRGAEIPIPAVEEYIKKVDIVAKRVEIYVMPGLLDLATGGENDERDDE